MRHISRYEFELLQKKLERIESTLTSEECHELVLQQFELAEIKKMRNELYQMFDAYSRQLSAIENLLSDYHSYHHSITNKLRVRLRILNGKLGEDAIERERLGLPEFKPGNHRVLPVSKKLTEKTGTK